MIKHSRKRSIIKQLRPFIKGITAGIAGVIVFSLLFAFAFYILGAPEGTEDILSCLALGGGCALCGFFVGGCKGKNGFFWGAVGGFIMFVLCVTGAIIFSEADNGIIVGKFFCCVLCGTGGGIIGVNLIKK